MELHQVKVRVAGKSYTLSTTESAQHVQRVLGLVNRKLDEIRASSPRIGAETAAVSVSLTLADELIKAQDDNTRLRRSLREAHEQQTSS
jgi:cell division protein ZapA (FtsZ GTPase activity inhibitor)